jgi:geranylgeranyl pyrophosphate synthase
MKPLARNDADPAVAQDALGPPSGEPSLRDDLALALYDDARAFLARPGKALRARLIQASFELAGGSARDLPQTALDAIELLHGGSLIIDDIQDDAELRRGAPALHRLIGTPRALNTGNWLYFVALERLDALPLDAERARTLTRAAHRCFVRCHEGQALDLALRVSDVRRGDIARLAQEISAHKTAALTSFAASLGATLAGAPVHVADVLASFGHKVGLALQMLDDLGSLVEARRHHKALEDLRGQRVGWAWAWASEVLDELSFKQLVRLLARDSELTQVRERLADAVEPLGRMRVHAVLEEAREQLAVVFPESHALATMQAELSKLERSYG